MNILLLAWALTAQEPPVEVRPLDPGPPPPAELSPAHEAFNETTEASTAEARAAIQDYGRCVAERSADLAADTLARDFRSRDYRSGLYRLSRSNEDCFRRRGRMRSSNLLFAGAIAETLIKREGDGLNARLARAASGPATESFSTTDRIALCLVRSVPDDVARLFATEVASEDEVAAAEALELAINLCSEGAAMEITPAALRAMTATAAFRQLRRSAQPQSSEARN